MTIPTSRDEGGATQVVESAANFSLTRGGFVDNVGRALQRRWRFAHGDRGCAVAFAALSWLPLALFGAVEGAWLRGGIHGSLAWDLAGHVRALIGIPILVLAEGVIDERMRHAAARLAKHERLSAADRSALGRALDRAQRLAHAPIASAGLIALAYAGALAATRTLHGGVLGTWITRPTASEPRLSSAGAWYLGVSLPLFQFLILQSLWRWAVWSGVLWRASRLRLALVGTHPDGTAGLAYLTTPVRAFAWVILATTVPVSATWSQHLVAGSTTIDALVVPILVWAVIVSAIAFAPMVFFVPMLRAVQLEFGRRYTVAAEECLRQFDRSWITSGRVTDEREIDKLPTEALMRLGDLANNIRRMRLFPPGRRVIFEVLMAVMLPMTPLLLAATSPRAVLKRLIEALL